MGESQPDGGTYIKSERDKLTVNQKLYIDIVTARLNEVSDRSIVVVVEGSSNRCLFLVN